MAEHNIFEILRQHRAKNRGYGALRISVFGSFARDGPQGGLTCPASYLSWAHLVSRQQEKEIGKGLTPQMT